MKKITALFAFMAFTLFVSSAQAQSFSKGDNVLNLSVGFGSGWYSGSGYSYSPALAISMEHCFWDDLINGDFSIGIGGYLGFATAKYRDPNGDYGWNYTTIAPAGRGVFHWTGVDKLDTYAGLNTGFDIRTSKEYGNWPGGSVETSSSGGFYTSPFIGVRYYFTESFCVMSEMGAGIAYFNVGVGFKF